MKTAGNNRILLYSHDSCGLGHLRRSLAISTVFQKDEVALISGSPVASDAAGECGNAAVTVLPKVRKIRNDSYCSADPTINSCTIFDVRSQLILNRVKEFSPDMLIVDKAPLGLMGELIPTLEWLKSGNCEVVLGLRDILDEPKTVKNEWADQCVQNALENVYDRIWIYGCEAMYPSCREYGFSQQMRAKTVYTGYVVGSSPVQLNTEPHSVVVNDKKHPKMLVMAGGGEDGQLLFENTLELVKRNPTWLNTTILTGPFYHNSTYVAETAKQLGVTFVEYSTDTSSLIDAADIVLCMGGYNTLCEVLCRNKPCLVVPRDFPRKEQVYRAKLFSQFAGLDYILPSDLTPDLLEQKILAGLQARPAQCVIPFNGLMNIRQELERMGYGK
ncbi:MAG: glycosyltransferase family protein [Desulfovibrio sp.]